jgi:hypothetical protein
MPQNKGDNTMNLKQVGTNMTELEIGEYKVLFSYQTPVAALHIGHFPGLFKTEKKWSATTTRHISKWLDGRSDVFTKPQSFFDSLIAGVK